MDLSAFKKANKPRKRKSKLDKFKNEILDLRKSEYTYDQIVEFLKLNGIVTTLQNVRKYIERHSQDVILVDKKREEKEEKEIGVNAEKAGDKLRVAGDKLRVVRTTKDIKKDESGRPKLY